MTYNLIDEPWIKVKYLDGTVTEVGIRKCFEDAEIIDDILAPSFRRDTMHIYYIPTLRLLTTIVMAAYFKPEQDFASRNFKYLRKFENGIYTDVIKEYLDKFHDRFDVLSADYPFLQNKDILGKVEENKNCVTWNPFIPSANNKVFGKNRSQDMQASDILSQYEMTVKEYAYYLLYTAVMGVYPSTQVSKETALEAKAMIYISLKGKNLLQTICNNVLNLNKSNDSDCEYDRPVWELDRVHDVETLFPVNCDIPRQNNKLVCSFYPGISIMNTGASGSMISGFVRTGKETLGNTTINQDETEALADPNVYCCDSAVSKSDKDGNKLYKEFNIDSGFASSICIAATSHIGDNMACNILSNHRDFSYCSVRIFFRVFDGMKVSLFQCGEISGNNAKTWEILTDRSKHDIAVKYYSTYSKIEKHVKSCVLDMFSEKWEYVRRRHRDKKNKGKDEKTEIFIKNITKSFSNFVESDFFNNFTHDLECCEDDAVSNFASRSYNMLRQSISDIVCLSDNMIRCANAVSKFDRDMKKLIEGC